MICDALDSGNLACGIFVDLRKAFDTVDHQILLKNLNMELLEELMIGLIPLSHHQQFVSINGYEIKIPRREMWSSSGLRSWTIDFINLYK